MGSQRGEDLQRVGQFTVAGNCGRPCLKAGNYPSWNSALPQTLGTEALHFLTVTIQKNSFWVLENGRRCTFTAASPFSKSLGRAVGCVQMRMGPGPAQS